MNVIAHRLRIVSSGTVLGFSALILPVFQSDYLLFVALGFLTIWHLRTRTSFQWGRAYILFLSLLLLIRFAFIDFPTGAELLKSYGSGRDLIVVTRSIMELIPITYRDATEFLRFLMLALGVSFFFHNPSSRDDFHRGLLWAVPVVVGAVLLQYLNEAPAIFPHYNNFWRSIHRMPGTLSDPNALGISSFLVCMICFSRFFNSFHLGSLLASVAMLFCGFLSGSRSFILGLSVVAAVLIFQRSKKLFLAMVVSGICVIAALNYVPRNILPLLPESLERAVLTIRADSFPNMLFSRTLFIKAGWNLWMESPFLGVGFNRFEKHFARINELLGNLDAKWVDNSNNFYLGLCTEIGILGVFIFLFAIKQIRFVPSTTTDNKVLRATIIAFLLLLIVGPHLDFSEVTLLFSCIVGSTCTFKTESAAERKGEVLLYATCALCFSLQTFGLERGVYSEEDGFHWFQKEALAHVRCTKERVRLELRSPLNSFGSSPLQISIQTSAGEHRSIIFKDSDTLSVEVRCPVEGHEPLGELLKIKLSCSRYWVPALQGLGKDYRILCAQMGSRGAYV